MKLSVYLFLLSTVFFCPNFLAQDNNTDSVKAPIITQTIKDSRIDKLNETFVSSYALKGYRIQIYSGSKKQPARQARLKFSQLYRKTKAHESYEQPYFKVRVGDFKTKIEALKFRNELIKHFPNCFIVKDDIKFKE